MAKSPDNLRPPYVGAIVMLVDPDGNKDIYPAIVTRLGANGNVNLTAFPPGITPYPLRAISAFDPATPGARGSWHWREEN